MPTDPQFADLIRGVRAGDARAAAELVRRYEPQVRRVIRLRLTDPRLGRLLESVDICQSVLANFFCRAAAGQFDLERPEQLLQLLTTMARNKLLNLVERHQAQRRDVRQCEADGDLALASVTAPDPSPSRVVAGRELLEQVRQRLHADERYLSEQRLLGRPWAELARELGGRPEALRKKLARALDRVAAELGLEEMGHD